MPFLAVALWIGLSVSPSAQTWTAEQQELWRLEEQQWKMAAAKDLSWIDTMVHPSAIVWGNEFPAPQNRASLTRWGRYNAQNNTTPVAQENAKKEREIVTGRYTDVFIREGNRWLFITWAGGDDPKQQ